MPAGLERQVLPIKNVEVAVYIGIEQARTAAAVAPGVAREGVVAPAFVHSIGELLSLRP